MTDKSLAVDNKPHELRLGASFDPKSKVAYHSIRYDFKPASVDTTKEAQVEIGQGHHVTLTVPHVEGSGKTHTVYKGNKRPVSKECVLIIDHDTGTFTLERLTNNISVKKTRMEGSSKVARPLTPVDQRLKSSPGKVKSSQSPSAPVKQMPSPPPVKTEIDSAVLGEISDSSSDSFSSDSDSDEENNPVNHVPDRPPVPMTAPQPTVPSHTTSSKPSGFMSMISADLQLSDSSDSDSD